MEKRKHWGAGHVFDAKHHLAGLPDDYTNAIGGITHVIARLLTEFAEQGGDLTQVQLTLADETSLGRRHLTIALRGFGA